MLSAGSLFAYGFHVGRFRQRDDGNKGYYPGISCIQGVIYDASFFEHWFSLWRCLSDLMAFLVIIVVVVDILLSHGNIGGFVGRGSVHLPVLCIGIKDASTDNQDNSDKTSGRDGVFKKKVSQECLEPKDAMKL